MYATKLRSLSLRSSPAGLFPDHSLFCRQKPSVATVRAESLQDGNSSQAVLEARQLLQLRVAAKVIPHPEKAHYGGEDAHFVSPSVGGGAIGVADGVGGWNESGISPAEYSRTFMETARKFLEGELHDQPASNGSQANLESDWMSRRPAWDGVLRSDCDSDGEPDTVAYGSSSLANGGGPEAAVQQQAAVNGAHAAALNTAVVTAEAVVAAAEQQQSSGNGAGASAAESATHNASAHPQEGQLEQQQEQHAASPPVLSLQQPKRTPLQALDMAHQQTRLPGSATACILRLDGERGILTAANLGDSGFLLIRGGKVVFQSPALQHFFDCPYQFGAFPEHAEATDTVDDAAVYDLEVHPGDVIVLATDGLLDNCYTEEIVKLAPSSPAEVEQAAAALAQLASDHAQDPGFDSPYTIEAAQEGFDIPIWEKLFSASIKDGKVQLGKLTGGKLDDITCVVAYVEAVGSG